ncbi:hypothetical protein HYV58_01165 [Candidatus Peregrinibacteria bacterium]|nr:hypothetical protein [Candidatus Peregrinibacteria bacterium]
MKYIFLLGIALLFLAAVEIFVLQRRKKLSEKDHVWVVIHWKNVTQKLAKEPARALTEADAILDFVLKKRGFQGSLADKLRKADKIFTRIDDVWTAHKLRNRAVHEVGFHISEAEARRAISSIQTALADIGVRVTL